MFIVLFLLEFHPTNQQKQRYIPFSYRKYLDVRDKS